MKQFLWEFHSCPFGKSIYAIALDGDKIIGTNCVIPIILTNSRDARILTGKSEDTLIDPEYRGQNIFSNIYNFLFAQCQAEGIKAIWGFTSAKKPFQKINFSIPFDQTQSIMVNKLWSSYKYLSSLNVNNGTNQKILIFILCLYSKIKKMIGYLFIQKLPFRITNDHKITDHISGLIESSAKDNSELFFILQTKEFQEWRIYNNPNYHKIHTYGVYGSGEKLIALIILNSKPNNVAYVVQSSFDSSLTQSEKVIILKHVVKKVFTSGISLIRNWHFDTNEVNAAEIETYSKSNFIYIKKGIGFVWREMDSSLNPNNFLLSRISTQGVT